MDGTTSNVHTNSTWLLTREQANAHTQWNQDGTCTCASHFTCRQFMISYVPAESTTLLWQAQYDHYKSQSYQTM